ncbi:hypothetical protein I305_04799 [Cryptococcus gattii E566]|uniref:Uncharacterized protein n=2 Tax=Cryptococcus gattii TaxID=37769 RepID=E6RG41_CRYGW|nr:Hypothetical Protein CGB_N2160C [Cryptococcus gattii WM276]ADV25794.1 Hypothetical Protein CGB_N2160C [Cryptococcus gattii WM276]KIR78038.1 hypothetical protein I306_04914 [Cryptococcus gattii EJB2]KIY32643.1 hypothetical protein I305_04799 [Cryptococcus gattii E566]KJD99688.1 hypothetical protein I311_06733 [Cryptococcus gattii NT-10]
MKHIGQADRRLRHDAQALLCKTANARSKNAAAVCQANEYRHQWGKSMSAGDAEILNWTRRQLQIANQDLDIVRAFAKRAAGVDVATSDVEAGP